MVNLENSQFVKKMAKPEKSPTNCDTQNERVVILHGATGSYLDLIDLEHALIKAGYDVHNWDYPSTTLTIAECAEHLSQKHISPSFNRSAQRTHFVGFSMGGLVAAEIIKNHMPQCLGRVVTLGTPYHGSDIADYMSRHYLNNKYYGHVFGPAGKELTTAFRQAVMQNIQPLPYDLGSIAGNQNNAYFVARHLFNGKDNDGRVAIDSTRHPYMKDHKVVSADHVGLPSNTEAQKATINFLKHGCF